MERALVFILCIVVLFPIEVFAAVFSADYYLGTYSRVDVYSENYTSYGCISPILAFIFSVAVSAFIYSLSGITGDPLPRIRAINFITCFALDLIFMTIGYNLIKNEYCRETPKSVAQYDRGFFIGLISNIVILSALYVVLVN